MSIFEKAVRSKVRFETSKGLLTVEQVWDLPLAKGAVNLNDLAIELHQQINGSATITFVSSASVTPELEAMKLKLEILKHVISVKEAENAEKLAASDKAEKRAQLMAAIAEKQAEAVKGKSLEELQKELAAL
jgi:hypothetical protein